MSYILDALRKSEAERRQGKAPDLGQPVQMIYRPKRKPVSAIIWVALALVVNAAVFAYLFWPGRESVERITPKAAAGSDILQTMPATTNLPSVEPTPVVPAEPRGAPEVEEQERVPELLPEKVPETAPERYEAPVVIVPSRKNDPQANGTELTGRVPQGRVPHLVELPLSFQKSVPDLTFNSHIYSSEPSASRVMINGHYLKSGDRFGPLAVERITEDGVVLSRNGQFFRVGTVRDWVSPR
ncbi:general secretion pathway protein GspB [Marinobacter daepoensis]|uniref:General secretion pathway protein GspB n=1 Tax=Marinobacter daepoensis TaxID=262077 RepID=A0ABS3BBS3_9GAMM|nr:general secretion pathway protein GspB [Marinobacter daepoensis]MBN7768922.1 general secretion pathway protein GspB [Marinobacter daepoensis]MBY6077612.1 general secretion pathway protein GspB [Marinobacter daepoensis]